MEWRDAICTQTSMTCKNPLVGKNLIGETEGSDKENSRGRTLNGRLGLAFEDLAWMDKDCEFLSKSNIMTLKGLKLENDIIRFSLLERSF